MHNLDRTLNEFTFQGEYEGEYEGGWSGETYGEVLNETDEMALAAELLSVSNEYEMEQFFGKLVSRVAGAARNFARSDAGKALGGILKDAAGKALPVVGGAIGGAIGGGQGQQWGERIGTGVKGVLGWEMEGGDGEMEFETARALVRTATDAIQALGQGAAVGASPVAAAKQVAILAAQRQAPQLLKVIATARPGGNGNGAGAGGGASGRWVREGNRIVLYGA
ncbi:hypothetical protein [Longimicrobium sp.]|uniref:hypothetical protein n=1 Tax=Longimicrobium sp. TaxID=2029185 RepID=UPI002F9506F1